jgi:essential nuclear protein 1
LHKQPNMPKEKRPRPQPKHDALFRDIEKSEEKGYLRAPRPWKKNKDNDDLDEPMAEVPMSDKMSKRILHEVHEQQREIAVEDNEAAESVDMNDSAASQARHLQFLEVNQANGSDDDELAEGDEGEAEEFELSAEDEKALAMFMPKPASNTGSRNLADIIMDAIRKAEEKAGASAGRSEEEKDADAGIRSRLDPRIIEAYTGVGKYLSHFKSGKVPKAWKVVPALKNWEEIVYLTEPDKWSAQAMFISVKLFSAQLSPKAAQRFYNIILLPRVRKDIDSNKKLNYHLYQALIRTIFKPAAFFKGILLPLVDDACTPQEAVVFSSVLSKASIPVPHSAVALMKLSQLEYSGPTLLFIKALLNKKYNLPFKVVDSLVDYFNNFASDSRALPVVWHQALLVFVQRYKNCFKPAQKQAFNKLLTAQAHGAISNEIRRELNAVAPMNVQQRQRELQKEEALQRMKPF